MKARPNILLFESANPRHAHEAIIQKPSSNAENINVRLMCSDL